MRRGGAGVEQYQHPLITRALRCGYPKAWDGPVCPVCGGEAEIFYIDRFGSPAGCEACVSRVDAWDYSQWDG